MKRIIVYTDGACSGNPGPGGWACVLQYGDIDKELSGYEAHTTNNRMELTAAIRALNALKEPCAVTLYSDSAYLINAWRQNWIDGWLKHGWRKANKQPVENEDLWRELLRLNAVHEITWEKVRGHANNPLNNRCDQLAVGEIQKHRTAKSPHAPNE